MAGSSADLDHHSDGQTFRSISSGRSPAGPHARSWIARHQLPVVLLLLVMLVLMLFPIVWMLSTVFKPTDELFATPPQWIPDHPTLEHLETVLGSSNIQRYAVNSVFVSGATTVIGTVLSTLAGYSLSRFRFRGQQVVMTFLLATTMFPMVMLLIPLYRLWASLALLNSYVSLVVMHLSLVLPLGIWLMKAYFDALPREVEEAAVVDGAGPMTTLVRVTLPLATPGVVVVALFSFLASWDEYLYTFTLVSDDQMRTLPVGMVVQYFGQFAYAWDRVMTLSLLMAAPVLLLFLFFQRYIVEGLTAGSVK